jgi:NADPH:quinone reductase-like Zn-dependent oxidoreductase/alpha-beta hydrolase superfamily lysophospholipase
MKAAITTRYGPPDIVQIRQVPKPEPTAGEVLINVYATTVSRTDCGMRRPHPQFVRLAAGLLRPKHTILGMDFAGVIETVGSGVTSFKPGDRVFGLSPDEYGAHAEYLCVPETTAMATMPEGTPFCEAVVCEGAWYADTYLQAFHLKPGHTILIYGAGGAIGTAAVQLAKCYGAKVTAVVATGHLELVKSLGAQRAVDYTKQDFTQIGETFDFVLDAVGKTTYFRYRKLLKPTGVFAATDLGPWGQNILLTIWSAITGNHRVIFPLPQSSRAKAFIESLKTRMEAGEFRPVIDRAYPLEAIAAAYRYVETEQKTGIVAINVRTAQHSAETATSYGLGAEFILGRGHVRLYTSIEGVGTRGVVWFVLGPETSGQAPYARLTAALHATGFATAVIHARGTGFSDGFRGDIDDYALFLSDYRLFHEFLAARFSRIFVFGQSVGAALALEVAASPSTPLAGLVLVNPAWKLTYAKSMGPTFSDYIAYAANYLFRPSALTVDMNRSPYSMAFAPDREESQAMQRDPLVVRYFSLRYVLAQRRVMNRCLQNVATVQAPILLVQGAHDAVVDPASLDVLLGAARAVDKRKLVAPDGGHGSSAVETMVIPLVDWFTLHADP